MNEKSQVHGRQTATVSKFSALIFETYLNYTYSSEVVVAHGVEFYGFLCKTSILTILSLTVSWDMTFSDRIELKIKPSEDGRT